ncbi:hypothetical protein L1987_20263 [Smallanthus sonchifolius]|uniref:Uncharacterized protein n=1 Tax=Smallanthus sonchifolius TaxID=185202 RepID=A0ACB9IU89_9ASTR|nr:hypothetical protein L1987_20263 [Smallanthus sonchifolius]
MIREVKFPRWLANVVVVQKKNVKWKVCVDYTDLNKACHKDPFPLPHIDSMVDTTAGHKMLTFMDASLGFQQIQMEPSDQEDTACNIPKAGKHDVQRETKGTMEVYIDDMVVKSKKAEDYLRDLREAFDILDQYNMKLNPSKCHFGVRAGKFLGYMVTKRGIEANPKQIKAIINLKYSANTKDVQRLTGMNKRFEWEEKHEQALQSLKEYLSSAPLLMKPEDGEPISLYLVVSRSTVSAVLVKDHEGQQYQVYYISKSLLAVETRKSEMSGRMAKRSVKLSAYDLIYEPRTAIKSQALADFAADFSSDIKHEADLEIQQLEESKDEWTLFTNGLYLSYLEDPEAHEVPRDMHEVTVAITLGKCDACQRQSNILHQPAEPLHPIISPWPFMKWGMDIVSKLPKALGGKVFMLAMTDYFSKWIEAEAFVQVREKEIISFIKHNILTRFWIPTEIVYDNGSQFIGKRTTDFCSSWGIKIITSTPVHPQANGQAESSNKIIINNLKKRLEAKKGRCAEELPFALWVDKECNRDLAKVRIAAYQQRIEKSYNKNIRIRRFQMGDLVLRKAFQNTTDPNDGKLAPKWEGSYLIDSEAGKGAYWLATMEGDILPRSSNDIYLKAYFMYVRT